MRLFLQIHLRGTTVVFATHDRDLIERVGRRVLTLDGGRLIDDRDLIQTPFTKEDDSIDDRASPVSSRVDKPPFEVEISGGREPGTGVATATVTHSPEEDRGLGFATTTSSESGPGT